MFRVAKRNELIQWPVTVSVPMDGGVAKQYEFTAHFKLLPISEAKEIVGDESFLVEVLRGWGPEVLGEDGNPLPFSDANRDMLCDISYVKSALLAAYFECASGAARKNSRTRRATG